MLFVFVTHLPTNGRLGLVCYLPSDKLILDSTQVLICQILRTNVQGGPPLRLSLVSDKSRTSLGPGVPAVCHISGSKAMFAGAKLCLSHFWEQNHAKPDGSAISHFVRLT